MSGKYDHVGNMLWDSSGEVAPRQASQVEKRLIAEIKTRAMTDAEIIAAIRTWHATCPFGDQVGAIVLIAQIEDALLKRKAESNVALAAEKNEPALTASV
jgi:hypothetical protein